jgi:branched-chain amino acid transport system substrate-binding protein
MTISRRGLLGTVAAATLLPAPSVRAQAPAIKLGVLNDMSGPYRDLTGMRSVAAVRQAVAEFTAAGKPVAVEVIFADHQNKPDVGAAIARQWLDTGGVDAIIDVPNSAVALAVQTIVRDRNKIFLAVGPATTALTGTQCSPNFVHWYYDTYMLAHVEGGAIVADGGDSWFFILPDYAFGHQLTDDTTAVVEKAGGKVLGKIAYPFPDTTDFSAFLVQAKDSGAKVLGLANAGNDLINSVKQAREFGLDERMRFAALLTAENVVHAAGPETMQRLVITQSFYWDLNERTRAYARRSLALLPDAPPNANQAGCYAATLHYLKTAAAMGVAEAKKDGVATVNRMKAMPFDDDAFGTGKIREDGRGMVTAYLFQVKTPTESTSGWDLYKVLATVPPEQAFRPLAEGKCSFVKT